MTLKLSRVPVSVALIATCLLSGCASNLSSASQSPDSKSSTVDTGAARIKTGTSTVSGEDDDGRRYYAVVLETVLGKVAIEDVVWEGTGETPAVNFQKTEEGIDPEVRQSGLPDNTDELPMEVGDPEARERRYLVVTLNFPAEKDRPEGELVLDYRAGDRTKTVEIVPSWG